MARNPEIEYCAFILWGIGLKYYSEVLTLLNNDPDFKVVSAFKYPIKHIGYFVNDIYSFHPPQKSELRKKIKDLQKGSSQDVIVIFAQNLRPQYQSVGNHHPPYLQCQTAYRFKSKIREKFNPKGSNGRYITDIIHSTDSEQEAGHIAQTIGLPNGLNYLDNKSWQPSQPPTILSPQKTSQAEWFRQIIKTIKYYLVKIKEKTLN